MRRSAADSSHSVTRRTLLKLPLLSGLAALVAGNRFAKAEAALEGSSIGKAGVSQHSPARRVLSLNGTWSLTYGPCPDAPRNLPQTAPPADWPTIPAAVPGNVELDLVAAGRIEPLEKGNRVYQALKLESHQWWYRRNFTPGPANSGEKAELVFDGLDCLGTVWLNGALVGRAENMLIPHRFDVSSLLKPNQPNEILVRIDPAVPAGLAAPRTDWDRQVYNHPESLRIRKASHMYGWDIMPRIVSAGLWRDVRLEYTRPIHLANVYWRTQLTNAKTSQATLALDWQIAGLPENSGHRVQISLRRNSRTVFHAEAAASAATGQQQIALEHVELWWPRGYGEQPLYEATVMLLDTKGATVDRHITRLGIRTVELDRTDVVLPGNPGKFGFTVNGVSIFVKGTDWSALDALHSRDPQLLERVFPLMVELNCNMVRCWGGNVYESDRFFDLCDEAGILVWQDFAMACAAYPQDEAFLNTITAEAESVVPRLRNHPSLALWSGNNECDDAHGWFQPAGAPPVDPNLDRITRKTIPAVLKRLDPDRPYLPSSPYHSPAVFAAGNGMDLMPEVHLWGPRGYFKAPFYTSSPAHFISEIGYHGCPARSSLEKMFDPECVHPWVKGHEWNDQWLTKSVRFTPEDKNTVGRNDLMTNQIAALFGKVPEDLDAFILASQITQAEAMKFFVELWRQQKGTRQGIIWWNIRDGWPILSDAIVDYYNTRKLAFYYIQRAQRDAQAICCEAVDGHHPVLIVNDTLRLARGRVVVHPAGSQAALFEGSFNVEPNGKATLGSIPHPAQNQMWKIDWSVEGAGEFSSHYLAFSPPVNLAEYRSWMKQAGLLDRL